MTARSPVPLATTTLPSYIGAAWYCRGFGLPSCHIGQLPYRTGVYALIHFNCSSWTLTACVLTNCKETLSESHTTANHILPIWNSGSWLHPKHRKRLTKIFAILQRCCLRLNYGQWVPRKLGFRYRLPECSLGFTGCPMFK